MKVLIDECLPHKLRLHLTRHEAVTAVYAGFGGLKNGALLQAAETAEFEVIVTGDLAMRTFTRVNIGVFSRKRK